MTHLQAEALLPLQADLGIVQVDEDVHVTAPHAKPVDRGPKLVDGACWMPTRIIYYWWMEHAGRQQGLFIY